ncbi:MAG: fatty-acyl-CoA synthase, partial [Thermodesulfobacteriota bacterium]|nr:fatty-acyl-CoA synthase [Thermodesulfobacteriota bacterium]
MTMLITEMLAKNARIYGDEIALIELEPAKEKRTEITWRMFDELANRICDALIKAGIKKGDTVVHLMKNCLEWLPIYFGILRTGALAVPLNFRFDPDSVRRCVDIAEAKAFFFGTDFIQHANTVKNNSEGLENFIFLGPGEMKPDFAICYEDFVALGEGICPQIDINLFDSACLYFTSGTTGNPKAVLLTH